MPRIEWASWERIDEDERCDAELSFAVVVLTWLAWRNPGLCEFSVDMTDLDELDHLKNGAEASGCELSVGAGGTLSGSLNAEMARLVVTCTQSVLEVSVAGEVRFVIVDYLDDMRLYVNEDELENLGRFARENWKHSEMP
jgi:hypothetical protein